MLDRRLTPPSVGAENKIQVYQLRPAMTWEARCNRCWTYRIPWFATSSRYANIWFRVVAHARIYHGVKLDA